MTSRALTRPLRDCGRLLSGGTPSKAEERFWTGSLPWFSSKEIRSFELTDSELHVSEEGASHGSNIVPPGSVLFVVRGMSLANEFRVGITTVRATFNQDVKAIVPASDIDPRYLARCLRWLEPKVLSEAETSSHGTKRLPGQVFESLPIPVPPVSEQRRIADILDKADAIRRKRKEAIALTDELLRSAFLEMFGVALPNVQRGTLPDGWTRTSVDELRAPGPYTCVGGPFGSNLTSRDYVSDGVPVIRGTNLGAKTNTFIDDGFVFVSASKAEELVQNMAYPGDLVFTQRGTLGQVALLPARTRYPRYVISQSQMKLTPDPQRVDPLFLHHFFCTDEMQRYVASHALATGVPHINLGILRATPVVLPPLDAQREFARFARRSELVRAASVRVAREADHLFESLVHRAFRGELTAPARETRKASVDRQIPLFDEHA